MSRNESMAAATQSQRELLCENLSFAASEAYKMLRANLAFAVADVEGCPVVGITSSIRGEAKTTTSINLSYMIAQTEKKVLLIDGDMRLPNIGRALNLQKEPGLSDVIVGKAKLSEAVRNTGIAENWDYLAAGTVPPNPSELLNSERMKKVVEKCKEQYDYIIVDLPPVGIVSDALVFAEISSGLIIVARQDYTAKKLLRQCIDLLSPVKEKILGLVLTDTNKNIKGYKYGKNKYRYYSKQYESYRAYGNSRGVLKARENAQNKQ